MTGIRAKARADTTTEIMRLARKQISEKGAPHLSLREIAREMGLASSALYRYFDSRDQLLTALIVESYDDLGDVVEHADARCDRTDFLGRWMAIAQALRHWALEHPSDYGLLFGTPVPGYDAPTDTVAPAQRYTTALLNLVLDAHRAGCEALIEIPDVKNGSKEYKRIRANLRLDVPDEMLLAGLTTWAAMLGAISLEIFGHVDNVVSNPDVHYASLAMMLGTQVLGLE